MSSKSTVSCQVKKPVEEDFNRLDSFDNRLEAYPTFTGRLVGLDLDPAWFDLFGFRQCQR